RGADIFTYLRARQACAGRLYTLKKNYRATQAMVRAANRCFQAAEERPTGQGAFLFRQEAANPVPFIPSEARGCADALQADGQALPALTVWWLPPAEGGNPLGKEAYRDQIAETCASEMVRLLQGGAAERVGFVSTGAPGPLRPLRPADLAVLVNKRTEANLIRGALARRGVRSVYLSDQDSVFQSPQAGELRHWLAACAEPDDTRLVRTALATRTLGLSWAELDQLNQDELALEGRVIQFRGYRDLWRRQGVLPMLRGLINDFQVPARLLGLDAMSEGEVPASLGPYPLAAPARLPGPEEPGEAPAAPDPALTGERVLTDLLHLAELLQEASGLLDGEHALLRYLAEACQEAGQSSGGDARQIRLETDADLVRVVTVHKAKGLEYPLVFLPFAADFRPITDEDLPLKWHDDQGEPQLSLAAQGEVLARADRERLGEDLRKLYVALTRARYATWVGLAPINGLEQGAFGYLLGGGEPLAPTDLESALVAWRGDCADLALVPAPEPSPRAFQPLGATASLGAARASRKVVREPWWIASYSAISRTLA
ncbi:MAG TPA: 3'-5' exonuclease, partial [Chromatiaceae bacterium]|nr:3'-5' exonuclease [Chromatiaceae bacterium]